MRLEEIGLLTTYRLTTRGAGVTRRDDAYQIPAAVLLVHQRTTGVTLARILAPIAVARTEHLLVDDHVDAVLPVPALADAILDHRHIDGLQRLGTQT